MRNPHIISKNGYLYIAYYVHKYDEANKIIKDENGKPKWFRKTITTDAPDNKQGRSAANTKLSEFTGQDTDNRLVPIRLSDFIGSYNTLYATKNKGALMNYTYAVNVFIRECGDRFMHSYTVKEVDSFLSTCLTRLSSITTKNYEKHLRTLFSRAMKYKHVKENVFESAMPYDIAKPKYDSFEKHEFDLLIATINKLDHPEKELHIDMVTEYVYQGFRLAELLRLKLTDIDNTFYHVTKTKTKEDRYVEIHDITRPIIKKYKKKNKVYLFERSPGKQIYIRYVQEFIFMYLKAAGLRNTLTAKAMRKTYGSWLLQAGVPIEWIASQMGNSVEIAARHYAKFKKQQYKGWINKM